MKKVVSLLLVLVLALGMSTVAFAAKKFDKDANSTTTNGFANATFTAAAGWAAVNGDVKPGAKASVVIPVGAFPLKDGDTYTETTAGITKTDLGSKITIRTKIAKGSNVLKKAEFEYKTNTSANKVAYLLVELVKPFKSNNTDGQDFDITIYPVVDGKAWTDNGLVISGTLTNEVTNIDGATDYVDLSDSYIAEVDEYSKLVEYALGEGVSLFGRAIKGAKYWGVANKDATAAEDEMMASKGIDEVYHVPVIGLASVANYVLLNDSDPTAYVYDKDLKYLGLAKERLPYADTYYLSSKKLEAEVEEEPEEEEEEEVEAPVAPPVTGGTGTVAPTYDNPSTGK